MSKEIFRRFMGSIMKEMRTFADEKRRFEWRKLGLAGAEGVAQHLKEKHALQLKPVVEVEEKEGTAGNSVCISLSHERYTHEFWVLNSRFSYLRKNGKTVFTSKNFYSVESQFFKRYGRWESNRRKRAKAKVISVRDDAIYNKFLEIQKMKKAAEGEDAPAEGEGGDAGEAHGEGEDVPAEGEGGDAPADGDVGAGEAHAEGEGGGEGEDVPAEGEDVPAEGEDVPAEGEDVPAEGEDVPAEGEGGDAPADGDVGAGEAHGEGEGGGEGEDVPAEGEDVPAEGEGGDAPGDGDGGAGEAHGEGEGGAGEAHGEGDGGARGEGEGGVVGK